MTPSSQEDRDRWRTRREEVAAEREAGATFAEIAERHGMSPQIAARIWKSARDARRHERREE